MEDHIFHFNDKPALQEQSDSICQELYDDIFRVMEEDASDTLGCSSHTASLVEALTGLRDRYDINWKAKYGCAVLVQKLDVAYCYITVIGLDGWEKKVHEWTDGRQQISVPDIDRHAKMDVGSFPNSLKDELFKKFDALLSKAHGGRTPFKHQHTPSFVAARLVDVMVELNMAMEIDIEYCQGGTTDVGRHTGCLPRNTSFPLVATAYKSMLDLNGARNDDDTLAKVLCAYFLNHLGTLVDNTATFDPRSVDRGVIIIRDIRQILKQVTDSKYRSLVMKRLGSFYEALESLEPKVDSLLSSMPKIKPVDDKPEHFKPAFPDVRALGIRKDGMDPASRFERAKAEAKKNLNWSHVHVFDRNTANVQDAWVSLARINHRFWEFAMNLNIANRTHKMEDIVKLLEDHSMATDIAMKASNECVHVMTCELRSCELLNTWIAFCWAHRIAAYHHPVFKGYAAALNPDDLSYLSFQDAGAIDAVKSVVTFLKCNRKGLKCPFRQSSDTMDLALDVGRTLPELNDKYRVECDIAEDKIEERYEAILDTQGRLQQLDKELALAKQKYSSALRDFNESKKRDFEYNNRMKKVFTDEYYAYKGARDSAANEVSKLENSIQALDKKPPDLFFPLPRNKDKALSWLFFLFMPKEFVDLLTLAHKAETLMWARVPSATQPSQHLDSWYCEHRRTHDPLAAIGKIRLGSQDSRISSPLAQGIGVRQYERETGICFPDLYKPAPFWVDSDPFIQERPEQDTSYLFTEDFPTYVSTSMKSLLVMMPSRTRGNHGIACKDLKPDWLMPEEYEKFSILRAFPCLQLRQLLEAIVDDLLPFGHTCVHVLVRQLLYHVGLPQWKQDFKSDVILDQLAEQISITTDQLKESPNNADKLLLFGWVCSFFGQFNGKVLLCSKVIKKITRDLGEQLEQEIKGVEDVPSDFYWKQAKLFACAMLCHCKIDSNDESLLEMVDFMVLFKSKSDYSKKVPEDNPLYPAMQQQMAKRIENILKALDKRPKYLTKCLGLVIDGLPDSLLWSKITYGAGEDIGCFEACAEHHYSINIINGTVLVDGVPPGFLPKPIISNGLYRRTFKAQNFRCIVKGVGHYRTAKVVDDRFLYEFIQRGDALDIVEIDMANNKLEIEDSLILVSREAIGLPSLLTEPYSHWYSKKQEAIFLRDPYHKKRSIYFVMTAEAIFKVPKDDIDLPVNKVMTRKSSYERLLMSHSPILNILGRVEEVQFILAWVSNDCSMIRFVLPRLQLEFSQSSNQVRSINVNGFCLRQSQILQGTLPGITTYLVLVDEHCREKILVPDGVVGKDGSVILDGDWNSRFHCHIYDIHDRFGHFIAQGVSGRLHMAAMHAMTTCYIVEDRFKATGAATATELVRQCWTNEPLDSVTKEKLKSIAQNSNLSSTLRLMCSWIWKCSNRLSFLREGTSFDETQLQNLCVDLELDPLAVCAYRIDETYTPRLLPNEERFLLGSRQRSHVPPSCKLPEKQKVANFIVSIETKMSELFMIPQKEQQKDKSFPLDLSATAQGIEKAIYDDLNTSWKDFCSLERYEVQGDESFYRAKLGDVQDKRATLEKSVLHYINESKSDEFTLARISGSIRPAGPRDLLRLVLDLSSFVKVNPFLPEDSLSDLQAQIVDWMMLCVLEDKLRRLIKARSIHETQVELKSVRRWNPYDHINWLVFEVEQGLQIRPYQVDVVQQLLQNPSTMVQLSMGKGKTSVLVPMLILELTRRSTVVRINMLSSIIAVVKEAYRLILTASVQHIKICTLPFQRNFPLGRTEAAVISEELDRCMDGKTCIIVTPQHRNSLLLKQYDFGRKILVEGLIKNPFIDIVDESDAILHQSFQQVYAIGDQAVLEDGHSRWTMVEACLQILAESHSSIIAAIREDPTLVHREACRHGEFPKLRFLPLFEQHQEKLSKAICRELVVTPPHDFLWMTKVKGKRIDMLINIICDARMPAIDAIAADPLFLEYKSDILVARGCLAHGVLFHCLRARHRVNYGIDKSRRKMAVPFSASDTPKPRSDYSHPDVPIIYTCLSYYHDGLSLQQMKDAVCALQDLGPSAQDTLYKAWIESIRDGSNENDDLERFDNIRKVDTDNLSQLHLMHSSLKYCMKLISFWLNNFVFPEETHVFPKRRVTSAWNLVDKSSKAIGFSGTDDNSRLLPLFVKQKAQDVQELRATNGEMIDCILNCTRSVRLLNSQGPLWMGVLREAIELGTRALIDVGGLMAGVSNAEAAELLIDLIKQKRIDTFRGSVYFDIESQGWNVLELKSELHCPLQTSSLLPEECFVYFDESRCRGSDLKLKLDACAMVTLEPNLVKDKFLQGCARLRNLRPGGQGIILAGTSETLSLPCSAKDVLESTINSTAKANEKGIVELLDRGMSFYNFPKTEDIDVTLDTLYGKEVKKHETIQSVLDAVIDKVENPSTEQQNLFQHCNKIGQGVSVDITHLSEECERELENEEEEEAEEEKELSNQFPYREEDWDFKNVFSDSPSINSKLYEISNVAADALGRELSGVLWGEKMLCTENWRNTIQAHLKTGRNYLRPVNFFLYFPDGRMILVSEYEADKLLPFWWKFEQNYCTCSKRSRKKSFVKMLQVSMANYKIWLGPCDKVTLPLKVFTSAKLFRGYVAFNEREKKVLTKILSKHPRAAIIELLQVRKRLRFFEMSDLDVFSQTADENVAEG